MKIFVISLKDANDRRKAITQKMRELNLEFEFFDAVDGLSGLPKQYELMVNRNKAKKRLGKDMSNGEIACALSHALVYKKIVDEKVKHSIVLEDDAIIGQDFATMINQKSCEKSGKDFVYLYHLYARAMLWGKIPFLKDYNICKLAKTPNGSVAYYMKYEMACILAEKCLPISWVSDWCVDIVSYNSGLAVPRIVMHPAITQSNLENNRTGKKNIFGQFGFMVWFVSKIKKIFSIKVSPMVEGK